MTHLELIGYGITKHARKSHGGCGTFLLALLILALCVFGIGCLGQESSAAKNGIRAKQVIVTAYTSRIEETDETPCISSDGSDVCALEAVGDHSCAAKFNFKTKI